MERSGDSRVPTGIQSPHMCKGVDRDSLAQPDCGPLGVVCTVNPPLRPQRCDEFLKGRTDAAEGLAWGGSRPRTFSFSWQASGWRIAPRPV